LWAIINTSEAAMSSDLYSSLGRGWTATFPKLLAMMSNTMPQLSARSRTHLKKNLNLVRAFTNVVCIAAVLFLSSPICAELTAKYVNGVKENLRRAQSHRSYRRICLPQVSRHFCGSQHLYDQSTTREKELPVSLFRNAEAERH
jgi:hypothetical protein